MIGKIVKSKIDKCFFCDSCELLKYTDSKKAIKLCSEHYDEMNHSRYIRNERMGTIGTDCTEKGIIKSDRTFGTELECYTSYYQNQRAMKTILPTTSIAGSDGSINGAYNSEIRVAIMKNKDGEDYLRNICNALQATFHMTNQSCGTHVHIGIPEGRSRDGNTKQVEERLKLLTYFYVVFEPVIRSLLPMHRNKNNYCIPLRPSDTHRYTELDNVTKKPAGIFAEKEFSKYYSAGGCGTRYYGINFASLYEHGTLEIRYHEGTINADNILHWIALHSAIVDLVMEGKIDEDTIAKYAGITDVKDLYTTLKTVLVKKILNETVEYLDERFRKYHSNKYMIISKKKDIPKEIDFEEDEYDDWEEDDDIGTDPF